MEKTKNLGLSVVKSNSTRVLTWISAMSDAISSNMTILDEAVSEKAISSQVVSVRLLASAWSGVDSPFTQGVLVEGLMENQNGSISVAQEATMEERNYARDAMLSVTGQVDGMLQISADGEMPEVDIPVSVVLLG